MNTPDALSVGLAALEFSRQTLLKMLEGFPAEKACHQPFAGANHMLWNLGHLAWVDDLFLTSLAGQTSALSPGFVEKFAWKTAPTSNPADYPDLDTVRRHLDERRSALIKWFTTLTPALLAAPTPSNFQDLGKTLAELPGSIACHECMHVGQITVVRKSLGLPPQIG